MPAAVLARKIVWLSQSIYHRNIRRAEECETLLEWLDPRAGEKILDVGCGDGFYDARIAASGAEVAAIDIHEPRLAFARRYNASPRIDYRRMDAERMEFGEGAFDKAVSFCVIEHFEDDVRVLGNIARALRPGGRLVLSADSLSNPEVRPAEREAHRRRYAVRTFYTEEVLREKLGRAGLELVRTRYILTAPLTLALVRLSWKLDNLPRAVEPLAAAAKVALGIFGRPASALAERRSGRTDSGLTILAVARKPQ